jgi:site-specific recombinase XerD
MLDDYFVKSFARKRLRALPLGPYLEDFVAWLEAQRYPRERIARKLSQLSFLNRWLRKRRLVLDQIDEEVASRCVATRRRRGIREGHEFHTYRQFIDHLRRGGHLQPLDAPEDTSPARELLNGFREFLLKERRIAETTARQYGMFVQTFLQRCFGNTVPRSETLTLEDLTGFLLSVKDLTPGQVTHAATALRTFGRFLLARGVVDRDISLGLPRVTRWYLGYLPERLSHSEVERLLASQDRRTEIGKRDYALIMIFARLGLRTCEAGRLTLEDVHWRGRTLRIFGKGGTECLLPLVPEVGESLADYLKARPRDVSRRIFLTVKAPRRPLESSGIAKVVRRALREGDIRPHGGPHLLRHSLASELLHHGASLSEVGQVLQHRHPSTTQIYAKVRVEALRELALPWPKTGGEV